MAHVLHEENALCFGNGMGILSPPGPFLTPSPSPSISASPRLQPSPSLSPFPQDVLLVTGNALANNSTHEQERKTVTPGRRQSIHQFTNGSPSAGTVVFQPSPSQSPAAATSVIGVTSGVGLNVVAGFPSSITHNTITTTLPTLSAAGNELNTTLVGSNNIQLNKKGTKRQQQQIHQQQQQHHQIYSSSSHYSHLPSLSTTTTIAGGYGLLHATTISNTPNTFATTTVASTPKNQTKKFTTNSSTVFPITHHNQQSHQTQQQQFQHYQTSSPLIADSPSPSPSSTAVTSASIKSPTPQPPMHVLQQQFTIASNSSNAVPQQTFQLIQGPQGQFIAAATSHHQHQNAQQQQQQQNRYIASSTTNIVTSPAAALGTKPTKTPQQILPKPQHLHQQQQQFIHNQHQQQIVDQINLVHQQKSKTSHLTPAPVPITSSSNMCQPSLTQIAQSGQQQQIILPSGATASLTTTAQQPLLLNQVPVLVQQNTPQGVQLILRPPTPQLTATPSLVIQNRAQPQHQQPQQVLRILGTNGATMQLAAATPTFIVSSQANLIQQGTPLQTIKTQSQSPAITQLSGLHAALSAAAAANSQQHRSQHFATTAATINGHLLSPSVAAQIQNLQLAAAAAANSNGLTAQIQMPNGLTTSGATALLSQLPGNAHFQQNTQGFNINLNPLSGANIQQIAAAAAAGATFQTPPPPQSQNSANNGQQQSQQNSGSNNTTASNSATNDLFSNSSNALSNIAQSSPAHCPVAVTPEPLRQPTPVLQNIPAASPQQQTQNPPQIHLSLNAAATIQLQQHQQQQQQAQIQQLQQQIQQTRSQVQQAQQQANQIQQTQHNHCLPQSQQPPVQEEPKKKPKPRKKKPPASNSFTNALSANNKCLTTTANKSLNTDTSTTSVLVPSISCPSKMIEMVPNTNQEEITNNISLTNPVNQNVSDGHILKSPSPPPPQIHRASNGKLDLGNVMKLCGITDEDNEDFVDSNLTEESTSTHTLNSAQNFTISIPQPKGSNETLPYTLSIPSIQPSSTGKNDNTGTSQEAAANIVIKIDPSETGIGTSNASLPQPYSITIPRLPSQEEIQKRSQQHLNNLNNDTNASQFKQQQTMLTAQPLNTNITFSMPLHSAASSIPTNNNLPQFVSNSVSPSVAIENTVIPTSTMPISTTTTTITTTATTATVKPRRKPTSRRNTKKDANSNATSINSSITSSMAATTSVSNVTTAAISTPLATPALVPSQIGNIQISQIENRVGNNQTQLISAPVSSLVENKIQIMPIMDKNSSSAQAAQLQQTQIVFQHNNAVHNLTLSTPLATQGSHPLQQDQPNRQMQLVALPHLSNTSQTSSTSTTNLNQQQSHQSTLTGSSSHMNTTVSSPPNNFQNTLTPPVTQATMLPGISGNVSISVGTPNTIGGIIPQLTGSLTLAVSEQCERLILRHDPNQPQDQQTQIILQALVKGALPNVTIINEPTKVDSPKMHAVQQPLLSQPLLTAPTLSNTCTTNGSNSTAGVNKSYKKNNKQNSEVIKQLPTSTLVNQIQKSGDGNANTSGTVINNLNLNSNLNTNSTLNVNPPIPPNITLSQQRYIALPKIDPSTQQLFSLNPLNNQITPINSNQTTASIGPTERLLIAPAGINAQQLAQCLQQGQLHFNDVNPLSAQQVPYTQQQQPPMAINAGGTNNQQPKQQIVYPMTSQTNIQGIITTTTTATVATTTSNTITVCSSAQPASTTTISTSSTTTKQIANVAPIIDQSKAKHDTKHVNNSTSSTNAGAVPKKKPVRKPKASTTTAADVALMKNASVVKPMPKLDPLSQKPNNNPVQIVQPNTASGKPVASTSTTSTSTTTTSNVVTIQPFQTQISTGTKLVGVTAPMQQQPQNNILQPQQQQTQSTRTQTNFNLNFSCGTSNNPTINATPNLNTTSPSANSLNSGLPLNNTMNNASGIGNLPLFNHQHTVSRVQTIQLTPQQQQMFKQVQMQIQYLTVKLQHRNLLSSMPLPADLDPNVVAAFNKPMTDMEINTALQRLFMEQHRILAAGKEIPTPEPFTTNPANAANNFPLMQPNNFSSDKNTSGIIPSNIVQPNNHSTLNANMGNTSNVTAGVTNTTISNNIPQQQTQKIHIYPIQHQQQQQTLQQNKQNKQTKQQVTLNTSSLHSSTPTPTAALGNNGSNIKVVKQKTNQSQQQQQINVQQLQNSSNNNFKTHLLNQPMLNPQLPQLSSLSTAPSLPSLPYPSLPPPHMINIANMPAVLQQKHFTQHLQMQQQQLMQQQQQQKLQNSKASNNTFTTFNSNLNNLPAFQQGPPPLIFPTSTTSTTNNTVATIAVTSTAPTTVSTIPQLSVLNQQQQLISQSSQQQTQIQFQNSTLSSAPTFAVTIGNQKAYVPIVTSAIISLTSSVVQQTSVVSSSISSTSLNTVVSALPQLITATSSSPILTTTAAAPSVSVPTPSVVPLKALLTQTPASSSNIHLNNSIVVQNSLINGATNVNIVGNPIAQNQTIVKTEEQISPKAKLARLSLFLQQLEVDQKSSLNPDYKSPFQNKEEAVKRLIRYHCMYQTDEDIPSEEEEEFEKSAIKFQDKFCKLSGKFQQLLLQESMLQHRTSEICQMEKLMIEDLQQEIENSKQLEKNILQCELEQQLQPQQDHKDILKDVENLSSTSVADESPCSPMPNTLDKIKNEVKTEPLDIKLDLESNSNIDGYSNFCNNVQSSSPSLDSIKNEIKGEPCDNSSVSSSCVKSSCSSMDSFDLLKQSPIVNSSFKKQNNDVKEPKKEEISNQWKQSYMDSKSSNSYYNHLANASISLTKPATHLFNGVVKKQLPLAPTAIVSATVAIENKKDEKDCFENFDIETEITPSVIMKKQEPKELAQTAENVISVTTTTSTHTQPPTTTNSNNTVNKNRCSKVAKQAKINHTFEKNLEGPLNDENHNTSSCFPQNQQITSTTAAAHTDIVTNNFDFSHHLPVNQTTTKQQEDDWLCIQKELNLMNSVDTTISTKNCENSIENTIPQTSAEPLVKSLDFLSNATSDDLFPDSCLNKNMESQSLANVDLNNCSVPLVANSCSQQNQQPSLTLSTHDGNQQADLNEFFSGSEDSEVHKDVETKLEAMFGESPVHLSGNKDRSDSPDDIESGLESIFGKSNKSPTSNRCITKEKTNWQSDFSGNSFMASTEQHSTNFMSSTNNMPHHIQLGSANNPRWMQNMEAQFPDFLTTNNNGSTVSECLTSRKRQWHGNIRNDLAQHSQHQEEQRQTKKLCDGIMNNGVLNDSSVSSSSPLSIQPQPQPHHHHHNLGPNDTSHAQELMDAALLSLHDGLGVDNSAEGNPTQTNNFNHMISHHDNFSSFNNHMNNNQQQPQHFMNINQHQNMNSQQQHLINNHMMQMNHGQQQGHHHAGSGEFDDDITRQVQNAIDSILNLQSSEADSISFSLDHSMGSLLGDTILNDDQNSENNLPSSQEVTKRRPLVDELGDCLMGNSSDDPTNLQETPLLMNTPSTSAHSQLMNHSVLHHSSIQQHHGHVAPTPNSTNVTTMSNHHHSISRIPGNLSVNHAQQQQLNDFNCVVSGIDEAVKSIMTS